MFAKSGKTGDEDDKTKYDKHPPKINLDHITCNDCGEKGHFAENIKGYTQTKLKEDAEAFRKMKQGKYGTKPPDGGGKQKTLVNAEVVSCSFMMGIPTEEWDYLLSTGLMFFQTSSQEVL